MINRMCAVPTTIPTRFFMEFGKAIRTFTLKDKGKEGVKDSGHNMGKQSIMGAVKRPTSQNLYKC